MDRGSWHCTGDRNGDHPHGKEMPKKKEHFRWTKKLITKKINTKENKSKRNKHTVHKRKYKGQIKQAQKLNITINKIIQTKIMRCV